MLLDSASLYFRAFHALPESITAPDGTPVNAVRGFVDVVARLVSERRPARLVACLDADWRPAFRVAAVPSYKAHRVGADGGEDVPAALAAQVPVIEAVLDAVGVARLGVPGFEADDVMATLAARDRDDVEVVTGDRDLFQVVRDAEPGARGAVRVLYTGRGVARLEVLGPAEVAARYGIPGSAYAEFAVLRGDPSDGLPGVPGVGEKTAAALVRRFGSVAGVLAAVDGPQARVEGLSPAARRRLSAARDYLVAAEAVVRVREDVPVGALRDGLPAEPVDPEALVALSERYGLDSSVGRLLAALRAAAGVAG
jgi:5'-3' exonuclease